MKTMPMGPYPVEVGLCLCPQDWARVMRKRNLSEPFPTPDGNVTVFIGSSGERFLVVTFARGLRRFRWAERIGVIAHEATHVWQEIVKHISEDRPGQEVEACAVQWITQWLVAELDAAGWLKR